MLARFVAAAERDGVPVEAAAHRIIGVSAFAAYPEDETVVTFDDDARTSTVVRRVRVTTRRSLRPRPR
jgi:hypothetical protein